MLLLLVVNDSFVYSGRFACMTICCKFFKENISAPRKWLTTEWRRYLIEVLNGWKSLWENMLWEYLYILSKHTFSSNLNIDNIDNMTNNLVNSNVQKCACFFIPFFNDCNPVPWLKLIMEYIIDNIQSGNKNWLMRNIK